MSTIPTGNTDENMQRDTANPRGSLRSFAWRRPYYILEHLDAGGNEKTGHIEEIIVDYGELGTDQGCLVRCEKEFGMVAGRHAAVFRERNRWILRQLSSSDTTFLNGVPVVDEWFLVSGDLIQLGAGGPRFCYTGSPGRGARPMGMLHWLKLFRQQAFPHYRKRILISSLVVAIALFTLVIYSVMGPGSGNGKNDPGDLSSRKNEDKITDITGKAGQNNGLKENPADVVKKDVIPMAEALQQFYPSVYYFYADSVRIEFSGLKKTWKEYSWGGTGFLLTDGRFITSRHNVEPWCFLNPGNIWGNLLNQAALGGGRLVAFFTAVSPGQPVIRFKSSNFTVSRKGGKPQSLTSLDGINKALKQQTTDNRYDWAFINLKMPGNIEADDSLSLCLKTGQELHVIGYRKGIGKVSSAKISPITGTCMVASDSLHKGMITVNNFVFPNGNSGCPVFTRRKDGKIVLIGVSASESRSGNSNLLPVAALH